MALLLAPYNDSMRLGMGFNSYTQTMCIDGAVEVTNTNHTQTDSPSQVVTYSAKFVERLSDIVSSMNISYSSAIKKGTIEVAGNGNSIDEDKIKASDINLVVAVQVINQTTILESSAKFLPMQGVNPSTSAFNDAFGDCYISGFIEGGDFNSIISMRCLDRSKKDGVVRSIKQSTKSSEPEDFSMDAYSFNNSLSNTGSIKDTETTVSVNWMGGGQFKDSTTTWDIDSVYAAAAAFPAAVAKTPQRTWAILTKYKANRSFNDWAIKLSLQPLEYDAVLSYTAELFNNFMEYKQLIKKVQDIIQNREAYGMTMKHNYISTDIATLVAVRAAFRNEMNKIVAVVNVLSRNPSMLQSASSFNVVSKDPTVRQIIEEAISAGPDSKVIFDSTKTEKSKTPEVPTVPASPAASSKTQSSDAGDFDKIEHVDAKAPSTEHLPAATHPSGAEATPVVPPDPTTTHSTDSQAPKESVKIDLSQLIAPEIWADLLPIRVTTGTIEATNDAALAAAATILPPPPDNDAASRFLSVDNKSIIVHVAVCGIHDVTSTIQGLIKEGTSVEVKISDIDALVYDADVYKSLPQPFTKSLAIVYQYGDQPLRVATADHIDKTGKMLTITNKSEDPQLTPRDWSLECWSILGAVYGGKVFNTEAHTKIVEDAIRKDYNDSGSRFRRVSFSNQLFGEDPWPTTTKTGIVFYRREKDVKKPIYAAVCLEGREPAALTSQPQLAAFVQTVQQEKEVVKTVEVIKEVPKEVIKTVEVIKEVPKEVIKTVIKEVPKEVIKEIPVQVESPANLRLDGANSSRYSVSFDRGQLHVGANGKNFIVFPNGVRHVFQNDGNYVVYHDSNALWAHNKPRSQPGDSLYFQEDGNFVAYQQGGGVVWCTNSHERGGQRLVLSSERPYVEIFAGGDSVWDSDRGTLRDNVGFVGEVSGD